YKNREVVINKSMRPLTREIDKLLYKWENIPLVRINCDNFDHGSSVSYGLIVYCKTTQRWFMVKRKHQNQLLRFLWGSYYPTEYVDIIPQLNSKSLELLKRAQQSFEEYSSVLKELSNRFDE